MIISLLKGGLGNQMFQYAYGRSLAIKNNTELVLDTSFLETHREATETFTPRDYEIGVYNLKSRIATGADRQKVKSSSRMDRLLGRTFKKVTESSMGVTSDWDATGKNIYLDGHWQSEKYFVENAGAIKKDFEVVEPAKGKNKEMLQLIDNCEAVAVHVRRSDYVTKAAVKAQHGVCDLDYYNTAIEYMKSKVTKPSFFMFSDDPEWVKDNIKIADCDTHYVSHNPPDKGYEDIRLMKHCKNFIIANSSFSWWGAWLASNPEKIVIAPKNWFANQDRNSTEIVPESWIKM